MLRPSAIAARATQQWSSRVRFQETIEHLYAEGISTFIEVGPSSNLSSFVGDILQGRAHLALASNSRRRPGLAQLMTLLARLITRHDLDLTPLYSQRQLTELDLAVPPPVSLESEHQAEELAVVVGVRRGETFSSGRRQLKRQKTILKTPFNRFWRGGLRL